MADIARFHSGQRPIGASTITQQVVRHFLLSREVSITRKVKEAILAYRLDKELSKDRILEIYLNEIYLGAGAYGVGRGGRHLFPEEARSADPGRGGISGRRCRKRPTTTTRSAMRRRPRRAAIGCWPAWPNSAGSAQDEAKRAMAEPLRVNMRPEPPPSRLRLFRRGGPPRPDRPVRRESRLRGRPDDPDELRAGNAADRGKGVSQRAGRIRPPARMARADRAAGQRGGGRKALGETPDPPGIGEWRLAAVTDSRRQRGQDRPARRVGRGDPDLRAALGASDGQGPAARGAGCAASPMSCRPAISCWSSRLAARQGAQGGGASCTGCARSPMSAAASS